MTDYQRQRYKKAKLTYDAWIKFYPFTLEDLDGEEWRDIDGYEGLYQVSTFGRVKSFKYKRPRIMRPQITGQCYLAVGLHKENKSVTKTIHKLVAQAFIPNANNLPEIDHRYGVKFDNSAENLRWATSSENKAFAVEQGIKQSGEDNSRAALTNEQVEWCRKVYKPRDKEFGAAALAKKFRVEIHVIILAIRGRTYKNAGGEAHNKHAALTEEQIIYIRNNPDGLLQTELATKFGVNQGLISAVQLGKIYKNVGGRIREPKDPRIPDNVREQIRAVYRHGVTGCGYKALAKKFGTNPATIHKIVHEK